MNQKPLGWRKTVWTLVASMLLGPLVGYVIYIGVVAATSPQRIDGILPVFSVAAISVLLFAPCGLAGGVLLIAFRKFVGRLNGAVAAVCGALGAIIVLVMVSAIDWQPTYFEILGYIGAYGAVSAAILWYVRRWIGLKDL